MRRRTKIGKLHRPRTIAAIAEEIIDEFGEEEGPFRMCIGICQTLFDHPDDPAYVRDFKRWTRIVNQVCARRKIAFDAERACAEIISDIWNDSFKEPGHRELKPQKMLSEVARSFEDHVGEADVFHARGMGISLTEVVPDTLP